MEPDTYFLDDVADYGIIVAGQPIFNYQEVQGWLQNVGYERVARSQPVRSYLEAGTFYITGTDYTSALPNPWINIYAMLARKCQVTKETYGAGENGTKDETVGIADAIATMTILGAYAVHNEDWRGSLEVGKVADLVLLDLEDIFDLDRDPELCFDMENRILMTMVDGKSVFEREIPDFNASLSVAAESDVKGDTVFTLSAGRANNVVAVELEFTVSADVLYSRGLELFEGFEALSGITWTPLMNGNIYKGSVTLTNENGFTTRDQTDIAKFVFGARKEGLATMEITSLRAGVFNESKKTVTYSTAKLVGASATTNVKTIPVYSIFDINKDQVVDLLDLAIVLVYVGADTTDFVNYKVVDIFGAPIYAARCDVAPLGNPDGKVDMADVLEVYINYTP
jgi:DNA-binding XRE family transcriptional regulator